MRLLVFWGKWEGVFDDKIGTGAKYWSGNEHDFNLRHINNNPGLKNWEL